MFVLGVDPGLTTAGYGIIEIEGPHLRAVTAGVIRTDPESAVADRLAEIYSDLANLIAEYEPDTAAIEEVFVNRNLHTAISVGRASGVALLAIAQAGIPVGEYTPSAVKMALCGNGRAPKDQVQRVVALRLGLSAPPAPADAADALAVALCHAQHEPMRHAVERAT
jgi:crossover junction endodeoxyribonuclease RuvC